MQLISDATGRMYHSSRSFPVIESMTDLLPASIRRPLSLIHGSTMTYNVSIIGFRRSRNSNLSNVQQTMTNNDLQQCTKNVGIVCFVPLHEQIC